MFQGYLKNVHCESTAPNARVWFRCISRILIGHLAIISIAGLGGSDGPNNIGVDTINCIDILFYS